MENQKIINEYLVLFIIIGSLLYLFEGIIPKPLPWIKLGLANIVNVVSIYFFPFSFLLKLIFFRIIIGSFITGTFLTPTFFLSFFGGFFSNLIMFFSYKVFKENISSIGISVLGAVIHLLTQLIVVYFFLIKDSTIFYLTPILLLTGIITGIIVGYISFRVIDKIKPILEKTL